MGETVKRITVSIGALERALKAHLANLESTIQVDKPCSGTMGTYQRRSSVSQHTFRRAGTMSIIAPNHLTARAKKSSTGGGGEDEQTIARSLKPAGKISVKLRIVFLKIGTIDTIHDRYTAEILLQSKWHEPRLDGQKRKSDEVVWDQFWCPRLSVENVIGEPKETAHYSLSYGDPVRHREATVCETRRLTGAFFEFMELNKFPFDSQDLTVTVTSDMDESELELVEDRLNPSGVNVETFSCEQEWQLHQVVNVWQKTTTKKTSHSVLRLPGLCIAAKVSRRPQFFMWNIIVVMGVICSLAFVTFTVGLETPQSRLQLTFILLLTTVTFKFVVNKSLPRISYLTYMDKYILGTMFILCCVCVWHALVGSVIYSHTKQPGNTSSTTTTSVAGTMATTFGPSATAAVVAMTTHDGPNESQPTTARAASPSFTSTSSSSPAEPFCATAVTPATPTAPAAAAVLADKIALGILSSAYVGFHLFFVVLITCINKMADETRPNIEVEIGKDNPEMTLELESSEQYGNGTSKGGYNNDTSSPNDDNDDDDHHHHHNNHRPNSSLQMTD